jgi:hypothetical protein
MEEASFESESNITINSEILNKYKDLTGSPGINYFKNKTSQNIFKNENRDCLLSGDEFQLDESIPDDRSEIYKSRYKYLNQRGNKK